MAASRLTFLAWIQLGFTVCGVVFGIAMIRLLVDGGNAMACFDGDHLACTADPIALSDMPRSLVAGAGLIAAAATAVVIAHRHRRGRARRATSVVVLSVSAGLDLLAAIAVLSV